jgi:DNA modification methylase
MSLDDLPARPEWTKGALLIPLGDIIIPPNRIRKETRDKAFIRELAESIGRSGLINPIVVDGPSPEGKYTLIAGETRYRAMLLLGWDKVPATLRSNLSKVELRLIELEENIKRKNLSWIEETQALEELHSLNIQLHGQKPKGESDAPGWSMEKTAEATGASVESVRSKVKLARKLKAKPHLIEKISALPFVAAMKQIQHLEMVEEARDKQERGILKVDHDLHIGDCVPWLASIPPESVHLILTDPPYGNAQIAEQEGETKGNNTTYTARLATTDNLNGPQVSDLLSKVIPEFARILVPGGHFYIFFCFDLYQELTYHLQKAHLIYDPTPLIWYKGRAVSISSHYNYSPSYEPILFGRKPPREKRRLFEVGKNVLTVSPVSSGLKDHPFEKPKDLLAGMIKASTNPGEVVLDPFAGSGSTLLTAKQLGRCARGCEINPDHAALANKALVETLEKGD